MPAVALAGQNAIRPNSNRKAQREERAFMEVMESF
jgi:hypothetical protein